MKILRLNFKNLNSLKDEHVIEFEKGLLGEAGIFAITGPTGAGKSTILDAMTLALFGKAARYESDRNPEEVMTRGQGDCSAEVVFECRKGQFIARWSRARARKKPDGNLQPPKREIAECPSGNILTEKIAEADSLIEQLTGLDYDRFLRSVLLAQGRFKEFLDANDNNRGDLLEKITGTQIYSQISIKTYEVQKIKSEEIQSLRNTLSGIELLTDEELLDLDEQANVCRKDISLFTREMKTTEEVLKKCERVQNLRKRLSVADLSLQEWKLKEEAFAVSRKKLNDHVATDPFHSHLLSLDSQIKDSHKREVQIQNFEKSLASKKAEANAVLLATERFIMQQTEQRNKEIVSLNNDHENLLSERKELDSWLINHQHDATIEKQLPALRKQGELVRKSASDLEALILSQKELQEARDVLQEELNQSGVAESEARKVLAEALKDTAAKKDAFESALKDRSLEDWRKLAKTHSEKLSAARQTGVSRKDCLARMDRLSKSEADLPAMEENLQKCAATCQKAEKDLIREKEILADKHRIVQQARLIANYEKARVDLRENEACPLCGSLEHPYAISCKVNESADEEAERKQAEKVELAEDFSRKCSNELSALRSNLHVRNEFITTEKRAIDASCLVLKRQLSLLGFTDDLENDSSFEKWLLSLENECRKTESSLTSLDTLKLACQRSDERAAKAQSSFDRISLNRDNLQKRIQEKVDLLIRTKSKEKIEQESLKENLLIFNKSLAELAKPVNEPNETISCVDLLDTKSQAYKRTEEKRNGVDQKIERLTVRLKNDQRELELLKKEQEMLSPRRVPFIEWKTSEERLQEINVSRDADERREVCAKAIQYVEQCSRDLTTANKELASLKKEILQLSDDLKKYLAKSSFPSIDALRAARLQPNEAKSIQEQDSQLIKEENALKGRIAECQDELEALQREDLPSDETFAQLKVQYADLIEKQSKLHQRLGEIEILRKQDKEKRQLHATRIEEIKRLETSARPWLELDALIGSASGDKFSKFAQGLTLAQLLELANAHLFRLNERYQIKRAADSDLGLQIIDRYQADAIRSTRSLSGGESFLVSLALALGLSDLAGSDTRIDSLFIDEGFGTLDSETLDTALAALDNLRLQNRTIGIISHVQTLKQRITAQIQVSKAGNGYGTLAIVNT